MSRRKPTPDYGEQVEDLISQADDLPEGPAKVAIFEEAVALADLHQDVPLAKCTSNKSCRLAWYAGHSICMRVSYASGTS